MSIDRDMLRTAAPTTSHKDHPPDRPPDPGRVRFGRGCDTVSSLQPCRIVVQRSEAAFVTDMVTSNYVQPSSVVPQTEVSSASSLAALKGKFDSVVVHSEMLAAALNDY